MRSILNSAFDMKILQNKCTMKFLFCMTLLLFHYNIPVLNTSKILQKFSMLFFTLH